MKAQLAPKISVVIPIYKFEKYLFQCISSVVNNTLKEIEIILVDEGENDACYAIMRYFASVDERISIIHEKNGGYGASCNKGICAARGEYISIIESDDFIEETMLEDMYTAAKKFDADIVKTPFYYFYDRRVGHSDEKIECEYMKEFNNLPNDKLISPIEYPCFFGVHPSIWSAIYKRTFLEKNNITFLEAKGAGYVDIVFRIDVLLSTDKLLWLHRPYYNYRKTNENASTNSSQFDISASLLRWIEVLNLFDAKYKDKFKYCAKDLVMEIYYTTYAHYKTLNFSRQQTRKLEEIFEKIPSEVIRESRRLSQDQKNEMLSFKHASENGLLFQDILKRNVSNKKTILKSFLKKFHFDIILERKKIYIHVLEGIEKNFFYREIPFWNMFTLTIKIGK